MSKIVKVGLVGGSLSSRESYRCTRTDEQKQKGCLHTNTLVMISIIYFIIVVNTMLYDKIFKAAFNDSKEYTINNLKKYYRFMICFFIAIAFIRLFLLLQEYNYEKIIDYGQKVTVLIGALAALTFSYANTFENTERKSVRKIGEIFLKSFLYFVIGLMFSIGFRDALSKPPDLQVFPGILLRLSPEILVYSSYIIMFILFLAGFVMLIISAVYLGVGIYDLTKCLSK